MQIEFKFTSSSPTGTRETLKKISAGAPVTELSSYKEYEQIFTTSEVQNQLRYFQYYHLSLIPINICINPRFRWLGENM